MKFLASKEPKIELQSDPGDYSALLALSARVYFIIMSVKFVIKINTKAKKLKFHAESSARQSIERFFDAMKTFNRICSIYLFILKCTSRSWRGKQVFITPDKINKTRRQKKCCRGPRRKKIPIKIIPGESRRGSSFGAAYSIGKSHTPGEASSVSGVDALIQCRIPATGAAACRVLVRKSQNKSEKFSLVRSAEN